MPPKDKPDIHRDDPRVPPDSLPEKPEILPDDQRRNDPNVPPDSPPRGDEKEISTREAGLAPDGGASDHPIHDDDPEDMQPEDFERQVDEAAKGQLERRTDDESIDPRADQAFSEGSSEPLDRGNRVQIQIGED